MAGFDWDNYWDELKTIRAGRTKFEKSHHKFVSFASKNFSSFSNKPKQSVVKMISNLPQRSIKTCIDYTLKNSLDGFAINENGEKVSSKQILSDWQNDFKENKNSKDAWHLMFSINESCSDERNLKALQDSVKETLDTHFFGYKYSFVLHTHQNNPHVHVVLNKRNIFTNKKIHFNSKDEIKDFFGDVRESFAYALKVRGLNYENKNSLQKDLKKEFKKIKTEIKLETDDYTAKDKILGFYSNMQEKNKQDYKNTASRIETLNDELAVLKKEYYDLMELYFLNLKKRSKKRFKLAKQAKETNKILNEKYKTILKEINKINKISFDSTRLSEMRMQQYLDKSNGLILLENFKYNYQTLYPNNKKATKSDFENYKKVCRAIALHRKYLNDNSIKYFDDSLIASRMLGKNESIFALNKKLENLNKNLYLLNSANATNKDELKILFNDNKDFICEVAKKRLEFVEKKLLKLEKIDKNSFLFREYFKGIEVLKIPPNERLLKIKNERKLGKDILAEKGIKLSNSYTPNRSPNLSKNKTNDLNNGRSF